MKILIVRFSSLGDVILSEPLVRALKENINGVELHYLIKPVFADVLKFFEPIEKIWIWENKIETFRKLKNEKFDIIIDIHDKLNSFLVKLLAKPRKTVTYKKHHLKRLLMVRKMYFGSIESVSKLYFDVLKKIPIDAEFSFPRFNVYDRKSAFFHKICDDYDIPADTTLIGIFPGATHQTKRYPTKQWINFINDVSPTWKCTFILLGSHKEKFLARKLIAKSRKKLIDLVGAFSIKQLIDFMNKLDGFITNDSGPMHIAAALQKPQLALFGATHPKFGFGPLNINAKIIKTDLKCQPCSLHGALECPKKHFNCMNQISTEWLVEEFRKMLEDKIWQV